jgi:hypothetical protein
VTIEESHGRARMARMRLSDVKDLPEPEQSAEERARTGRDASGRFVGGNSASVRSAEKGMIERRERAALARELDAAVDGTTTSDRAQLLQQTLKLYSATRRDLPAESPVVLSATLSFAREHCVAAVLFEKATELGLTTPEGLVFLEAVQKAEARAERSSLHAFTVAAKLASSMRGRRIVDATPWLESPDDQPALEPEPEPEVKL